MNKIITLKQSEHYLLGSKEDIELLAKKDVAKVLVISDSHGMSKMFCEIIKQFGKMCDALVFCGDGISDFATCMDYASEDNNFAQYVPLVAAFVCGNGDSDLFPVKFNFSDKKTKAVYYELKIPLRQTLKVANNLLYIVHGHEQGAYFGVSKIVSECKKAKANIAIHGHTHIAKSFYDDVFILNPGSITYPRSSLPPTFAILELQKNIINTVFYKIDIALQGIKFTPISLK